MALAGFGTTFGNYAPNATYEGDNASCACRRRGICSRRPCGGVRGGGTGRGSTATGGWPERHASVPPRGRAGAEPESPLGVAVGLRDFDALLGAYAHPLVAGALRGARAGSLPVDRVMSRTPEDRPASAPGAVRRCGTSSTRPARSRVGRATALVMDRSSRCTRSPPASMDDRMGDFLEDGHVSGERAAIRAKFPNFSPSCGRTRRALVDAFALDDYFLNSALGASDGDVYFRCTRKCVSRRSTNRTLKPGYSDLLHGRLVKGAGP